MAAENKPCRQIGRVTDEKWDTIKAGAAAAGMTLTEWGVGLLYREALAAIEQKAATEAAAIVQQPDEQKGTA